jgi:hypothetical protein
MLTGGITAQTTHVPLRTHASLFERGEQAQVSKPEPIPAFAFVSLRKFHLLSLWFSSAAKNPRNRKFFCESCSLLQILTCSHCEITTKLVRLALINL